MVCALNAGMAVPSFGDSWEASSGETESQRSACMQDSSHRQQEALGESLESQTCRNVSSHYYWWAETQDTLRCVCLSVFDLSVVLSMYRLERHVMWNCFCPTDALYRREREISVCGLLLYVKVLSKLSWVGWNLGSLFLQKCWRDVRAWGWMAVLRSGAKQSRISTYECQVLFQKRQCWW